MRHTFLLLWATVLIKDAFALPSVFIERRQSGQTPAGSVTPELEPEPQQRLLDLFNEALLPRASAFDQAASLLSANSSLSDVYEAVWAGRNVTGFDNGVIRFLLPEVEKFTFDQAADFVVVTQGVIKILGSALAHLDARIPDVVLTRPTSEIRALVLLTRMMVYNLYSIPNILDNLYTADTLMPTPPLSSALGTQRNQIAAVIAKSAGAWDTDLNLPPPNSNETAPALALEPWQNPVLVVLDDASAASAIFASRVSGLTANHSASYFANTLALDPVPTLFLPYADEMDDMDEQTVRELYPRLQTIASTVVQAYSKLQTNKTALIRGWTSKGDQRNIFQTWSSTSARDSSNFRNFIETLLQIAPSNTTEASAVRQLGADFSRVLNASHVFASGQLEAIQ